jgi:hypothetical protein
MNKGIIQRRIPELIFFSLFLNGIFPQKIFEIFNIYYESFPFFTLLIIFLAIIFDVKYFYQLFKNEYNKILLILFFLLFFSTYLIEYSLIISLRYSIPIIISVVAFHYIKKISSKKIILLIQSALIFYIFFFIFSKYNILQFKDGFCNFFNNFNFISRGMCNGVNAITYFSPEPSYHSFIILFLCLFFEIKKKIFKNNIFYIRVLFIINYAIIESTLANFFIIIYVNYLILDYLIKKKEFEFIVIYGLIICTLTLLIYINNFQKKNVIYHDKIISTYFRIHYNFIAINYADLLPKKKLLNFKEEYIKNLEKEPYLFKALNDHDVLSKDISIKNRKAQPTSYFVYLIYDMGILFFFIIMLIIAVPFAKRKKFFLVDKTTIFFLLTPCILVLLVQSNFLNLFFWIILLLIYNYNMANYAK